MRRRGFLAAGGSLLVAFAWPGQAQQGPGVAGGTMPQGSLKTQPLLDGWIRIDGNGDITVFTGKAELGQGIRTALLQVAAEELVVPPSRITLVSADTARTPNEGYTAGSHSMQDSGTAIRHAAAQVRALLLAAAAQRLALPVEQLRVENGSVRSGDRSLGYGELAADAQLHVNALPRSVLRDPKNYTVVGRSLPRTDIPAKLTGGAAYVQDLHFEGMVHARIVRPPGRRATFRQLDDSGVRAMPGVLQVLRDGNFLGVVAQREFQAVVAARALEAATQWDAGPPLALGAGAWTPRLRAASAQDFVIHDQGQQPAPGARTISANYERPYQMHGSIGPSCAVALWRDGTMTVWTHSQGVFPLRQALAELLGLAQDKVRCVHVEGSGCYGHNGADDVAADAALLARAMAGRPVRVQWMRHDEHAWEPYGPPMSAGVRATLDAGGGIQSWQYEVWSNTHSTRPGSAGDLLAGSLVARPFAPTPPRPIPQPEGGGDRNAIPIYALPNCRITHHFLPAMPVRVSALRSLGAYMNVFAIESFMDELARAAPADPVAFRLRHLTDERARSVVQTAAQRFDWDGYQPRRTRGRGFAFARYKNLAAYAAIACEVEVWRDTGEVRILRVVAAVDSGEAVNPDGIRNQFEGGIVQSISWTLLEEVFFDAQHSTSTDWGAYPILRFPQLPERIDVFISERPGDPFLGTGEAAQGPAAAAIANAFFDATGVRMRELPMTRAKVRAALGV